MLHFGHSEYLYHSTPPIVVPFVHDHALSAQFDRWRKWCSADLASPVTAGSVGVATGGAGASGGESLLQLDGGSSSTNGTATAAAGLPDAEPVFDDGRRKLQSVGGPSVVPCYNLRKDVPFTMQASVRLDTLLRYLYLGVNGEYIVTEEVAKDSPNTFLRDQYTRYSNKTSILSDAVNG